MCARVKPLRRAPGADWQSGQAAGERGHPDGIEAVSRAVIRRGRNDSAPRQNP